MAPKPYTIHVKPHPGSTAYNIENEPEWGEGHQHTVEFVSQQDRRPGLTHGGGRAHSRLSKPARLTKS